MSTTPSIATRTPRAIVCSIPSRAPAWRSPAWRWPGHRRSKGRGHRRARRGLPPPQLFGTRTRMVATPSAAASTGRSIPWATSYPSSPTGLAPNGRTPQMWAW